MTNQFGAGKCSLCGSSGTSKTSCPLNTKAKNPDPTKHPLAEKPTTLSLLSNKSKSKSKSKVKPEKSKLLQLKGPGNVAKPSIKPPLNTMKIKKKTMKKSTNFHRLEFKEGNSNKFWQIKSVGTDVETNWGKIDTKGSTKVMKFDSKDKANIYIEKQLQSKIKKGYKEIKNDKSPMVKTHSPIVDKKSSPKKSETKLREPLIEMLDISWLDGYKHMEKYGRNNPNEHWRPSPSKLKEGEQQMLDEVWDMGFQEYREQARVNDFDEDAMPMWHHHVFKSSQKQYAKFYNIIDKIDPDNDGYYIDDKYDNDKHFINVINGLKKTILKDLKLGDILFVGNSGEGEGGFIMYLENNIYYDENGYSGPIRYVQNCRGGMGKEKECEKMKTIRYSKLVIDLQDDNPELYGFFGGDWLGLDDIKEEYEAVNLWD
jgi:predicted DNA-binding WGR domain protein